MWGLWLAQNQGDRSHKHHLPNTLLGVQDSMAGPRAEDRLLMSDLAKAVEAAGKQARAQPIPQKWSGVSKQ